MLSLLYLYLFVATVFGLPQIRSLPRRAASGLEDALHSSTLRQDKALDTRVPVWKRTDSIGVGEQASVGTTMTPNRGECCHVTN